MRWISLGWVVMAVAFLGRIPVLADGGPHGLSSPSMEDCLLCHRAHVARGASKAPRTVDLCMACHGASAFGAHTDVENGVYQGLDRPRGLRGGGFVYALMKTSDDPSPPKLQRVTSSHLWQGWEGVAWGKGPEGSGVGRPMVLSCLVCHNPHGHSGPKGQPTYRLLRPIPLGVGSLNIAIPDERVKHYTIDAPDGRYFGQWYPPITFQKLAYWCSQCHQRYLATPDHVHQDDAVFTYRHVTVGWPESGSRKGNTAYVNRPFSCLTCHVAHGTAAHMVGYAAEVEWPGNQEGPLGDARSSLLRMDNRGVCQGCHHR